MSIFLNELLRVKYLNRSKAGMSSMPEDVVKRLNKRELRDLVEFLSTLR